MTETCSLCDLPTPSSPITGANVDGTYCCQGCLEVTRRFDGSDIQGEINERASEPVTRDGEDADGFTEAFLAIDGMHCTTCEAFLSLRGDATDGIGSVEASYATDTARVSHDPDRVERASLPEKLSGYGYTARFRDDDLDTGGDEATVTRLVVGAFLAMLVMPWYLFFLYPRYVGIDIGILTADMTTTVNLYFPMVVIALLATGIVFYTGWPILRGAYVSLTTGQPNMDLLLSVAILGSYSYSSVALATGSLHLYYDVSIAIVLVVTAGTCYEQRLKRQATGLLSSLTEARVHEANRRTADGNIETVSVEDLSAGETILVRPGERVPADGIVREGTAAVDEAILTGESLPTTKEPGDDIVGGAVVTDSSLVVEIGDRAQNTLDRITSLLWNVQSEGHAVQRFADRLATVFVPLVLVVAGVVTGWRLLAGGEIAEALLAGLTVLVAACPCAMGLATPLAVAGGLRDALERGVVVTNGALFESAPSVETVVFDKTGTLTTGEMTVREFVGDQATLEAAVRVERHSAHPVASAIVNFATDSAGTSEGDGALEYGDSTDPAPGVEPDGGIEEPTVQADTDASSGSVTDFERHPGDGVSGRVDGDQVVVGTPELVERRCSPLPERLEAAVETARDDGHVPVVIGREDRPKAVAVVGDREREDWQAVLENFSDQDVVVLTGDDESAAERFRTHPAVDSVFAGVPPDGKVATIRQLGTERTTAMVGDGTNDAPALAGADVGVAVAGTARAAEAADVVVPDGTLSDVPVAFTLASGTRRRIRENIGWALLYNAVALPLAALGVLNPLFAAVAMATSSILVVSNSSRPVL